MDQKALQWIERRDRIEDLRKLSLGLNEDYVTTESGIERGRYYGCELREILGGIDRSGSRNERRLLDDVLHDEGGAVGDGDGDDGGGCGDEQEGTENDESKEHGQRCKTETQNSPKDSEHSA